MAGDSKQQKSSQVSDAEGSVRLHQHATDAVHNRGIYRGKYMTLHDIAELIRNPIQRKPTPEELVLIRMIEKLTNAIKSTVVGK